MLAWDASPDAVDGYRLYWGTNSGSYTDMIDAGTNLTATASNLVKGAAYYFVVTAFAGESESEPSNEVMATP